MLETNVHKNRKSPPVSSQAIESRGEVKSSKIARRYILRIPFFRYKVGSNSILPALSRSRGICQLSRKLRKKKKKKKKRANITEKKMSE